MEERCLIKMNKSLEFFRILLNIKNNILNCFNGNSHFSSSALDNAFQIDDLTWCKRNKSHSGLSNLLEKFVDRDSPFSQKKRD